MDKENIYYRVLEKVWSGGHDGPHKWNKLSIDGTITHFDLAMDLLSMIVKALDKPALDLNFNVLIEIRELCIQKVIGDILYDICTVKVCCIKKIKR